MNIKKNKIIFFFFSLLMVLFFATEAFSGQAGYLYTKAIKELRKGNGDFAFIYFKRIIKDYPNSHYLKNSLFLIGEYCYDVNNYTISMDSFSRFISQFRDSDASIFAYAYLLKMANTRDNKKLSFFLERELVSFKRLSLLFRDFKEFEYLSPSGNKYKALYYIDRIEFFKNEELFEKVSF